MIDNLIPMSAVARPGTVTRHAVVMVALLALGCAPGALAVEQTGDPGELVGIRAVTNSADNFSAIRGSIWVREQFALRQYVWDRTTCPNKNLTDEEVAALSRHLGNRQMRIIPRYQPGQLPGSRCLVEYILIDQRHVDDVAMDVFE
jgi:hypothetical protein